MIITNIYEIKSGELRSMVQLLKKTVIVIIALCAMTISANALNLFQADYDNDQWSVEKIEYEHDDTIPDGWIPLKAASEYLPIDVDWNSDTREIIIYSHNLSWANKAFCTFLYKADNLHPDIKIKDGVSWCSPKLMSCFLWNKSFVYNGELYYYNGENVESKLIQCNGSNLFKPPVLTALYNIKLKLPDEYELIRSCITGGIAYVSRDNMPEGISGAAMAYVYPCRENPVCYIVGDEKSRDIFIENIAHEAYHVWLERNGSQSEEEAYAHGIQVREVIRQIK